MADVPDLCASLRAMAVQVPACGPVATEAAALLERLAHELVEARASARVMGPRYGTMEPPEP